MQTTLEDELEQAFEELGIASEHQESIITYLGIVKNRDQATYEHCVRVGLKGIQVANFVQGDPKALFWAGSLHDIGKAQTDPKSLKKKVGFNAKDKKELDRHPLDGYRMLRGIHDFSAQILVRHHLFQKNGYPKNIPKCDIDFSKGTEVMIDYYARLLGLIDFYDSMSNRENDKFSPGKPRLPTKEEGKEIMLKANPDQVILINKLYDTGIF